MVNKRKESFNHEKNRINNNRFRNAMYRAVSLLPS